MPDCFIIQKNHKYLRRLKFFWSVKQATTGILSGSALPVIEVLKALSSVLNVSRCVLLGCIVGNCRQRSALAREMKAGFVAVNDLVKSDPRLPFGETKKSGVGRELSHHGLREFVNIGSVVIQEA